MAVSGNVVDISHFLVWMEIDRVTKSGKTFCVKWNLCM